MNKVLEYENAKSKLLNITANETDLIANLANASAVLNEFMTDINWIGFYLYKNDELVLGPFQGKPACVRIKNGNGVCGTAFLENRTQVVYDVHKFPGHIACDERSKSEIVIPINYMGKPVGVLDCDSPHIGRFDDVDKDYLTKIVRIIENTCNWKRGI